MCVCVCVCVQEKLLSNVRSVSPRDASSVREEDEEEEESGGSVSGEGGSEGGMLTMTVGGGEGGGGGVREEEVESDGCVGGCEGVMFFSVGEVRRRLSQHVTAPKRNFKRDPEDPSGESSSLPDCRNCHSQTAANSD